MVAAQPSATQELPMITKSSNGVSLAKPAPRVLPDLSVPDNATLLAMIQKLQAENEALKAHKTNGIRIKVGEKGGMVVSGFGQYPYTFYHSQWVKFREHLGEIDAWFAANEHSLTRK